MTHDEVLTIVQSEVRRALEAIGREFRDSGHPAAAVYYDDALARLYPAPPKPEIEVVESPSCSRKFAIHRGNEEYYEDEDDWRGLGYGTDYPVRDIALAVRDVLRKRETAYSSANGNTINQ